MALESIENDFQDFLLRGSSSIEKRVVGTARVPIATRLAIYGDAYRARLIEALQAHYPALLALVGAEKFEALGSAYVRAHDSRFASIRFYGSTLGAFLASDPESASCPWLGELAQFEWAMTEVFDAADAVPVGVQALGEIAPESWGQLRFDLHPSVRRLELLWNAPALWRALTNEPAQPAPEPLTEPAPWLLWRRELQIFFRALTSLEAQMLDIVRSGGSFGALCLELTRALDETAAPARAAAFLREWVESGLIVSIEIGEE